MFTQLEFNYIVEGMAVYDRHGNDVGIVDALRLGEGIIKATETNTITMVETISEALGRHDEFPTIFYAHLFDKGFARVKRNIFQRDVLVLHDQIDDIRMSGIHLTVDERELVRV